MACRVRRPATVGRCPVLAPLLVLLALVVAPAPAEAEVAYHWPVPAEPVRAFDAPASAWAAGHRGVDLPARAGQPVHPMAAGQVVHAGPVAGATWVTVLHADGIRTSYGPLQPLTHAGFGDRVTPDGPLGAAAGTAHGTTGRLHVGARRGDRYLDPAVLVDASPRLRATLVGSGTARVARTGGVTRPVLVAGTAPSPNHLVVLPGLTSSTDDVPFDLQALGYGPGTWQQYSYLGLDEEDQPLRYGPAATWGRVHEMAEALQDQLRQQADERPGQAIDLMGHSLGGLVAMYYLLVLHDPTDPDLPPIGNIVTVASPLQGADSADAVARIRDNPFGRALLDLVETQLPTHGGQPVVHPDVAVLEDLQTDSPVARAVLDAWERHREDPHASPLATGTRVLTLGSTLDPVVNEHRSGLPGADHETVFDPNPFHAHTGATTDERSREVLEAFLAREPVPDGGLAAHAVNLTAGVGSRFVAAVEDLVARGTGLVSNVVHVPVMPGLAGP